MMRRDWAGIDAFLAAAHTRASLSQEGVGRIRAGLRATPNPFDAVVTELGLIQEAILVRLLNEQSGSLTDSTEAIEVEPALLSELGSDFAARKSALPLSRSEASVLVAISDPFDLDLIEAIRYFFDCPVTLTVRSRNEVRRALETYLSAESVVPSGSTLAQQDDVLSDDLGRLRDLARQAPVIKALNGLIHSAWSRGATDIHIEPNVEAVRIRYRVDGVLIDGGSLPLTELAALSTRIKILAGLNIVERRRAQDGRIRLALAGQDVDFRVSIIPSIAGESISLRILYSTEVALDIATLGYDFHHIEQIRRLINKPNGIVIVTGPTGSGKTTTLYAAINELNRGDRKIFTIEDPVEYRIDSITQYPINPQLGIDFASALRSVLRQDPDIILIGEIRDRESAQVAAQAALTGHLVLTTLHTNSAVGALTRLRDIGLQPYLVASTLRGVIAQRLVRKVCPDCRGTARAHEITGGCPTCSGTGYRGRTVVYEILEVTKELAALVSAGAHEEEIAIVAARAGMRTLHEQAYACAACGITTLDEVARCVDLE